MFVFEDFDTQIAKLKETYNNMRSQVDEMKRTLQEWNKDEEIQKAQEEADYWRRHSLCHLSDKELNRLDDFQKRHYEKCALPLHSKIVGNTYIYELTGTGIGTIIKITCPLCGESEDITDTSSW